MVAGSRNTPEPTMLPSTMEVVVASPKLRRSAVVAVAILIPLGWSVVWAPKRRGLPDATKKDIFATGKFTGSGGLIADRRHPGGERRPRALRALLPAAHSHRRGPGPPPAPRLPGSPRDPGLPRRGPARTAGAGGLGIRGRYSRGAGRDRGHHPP